ncbi:hypothetical protein [Cupriavidus oxalaticus]|uniref:DUF3077 domain-containing protein n=1 Tax=Cupriavidus oxalaticus TaxID=96344 RepID=A0A375FIJ3_9BURK|nr:hypothetical protein [Cupriavidus oxalaticus]QRQ84328.1 hypothetical protein JTE91_11215 [Cupriavidus oxalaticus]QRQ91585.1 hypothetical protein JTE92_01130 [Cupriavidus oxalaticus]WQD86155.1 hypothetical protein U0036_19225 [Cupriavidus oxalaticus]SPC05054.1 conserved hypothetical protein [Cupriavidus oxalaticus]SPC18282.1 conserved hypothetical protein [Cupriavidus oxalaticus]
MYNHSHHGITAEHNGADMLVTAHSPGENPLSLAVQRAAQLHGLLLMASDHGAPSLDPVDLDQRTWENLLSLAVSLAHETQVLSELAVLQGQALQAD